MTKLSAAVIFGATLLLTSLGVTSAASAAGMRGAGGGGGAPHIAAPAPRAAPSFAPRGNFGAGRGIGSQPHFGVHSGIARAPAITPNPITPNLGGHGYFRAPNAGNGDRHFRSAAPYVGRAPQTVHPTPPAASIARSNHRGSGRRYAGRNRLDPYYPFTVPYIYGYGYGPYYGYGTGLGVPYYNDGGYGTLTTTGACYPLLQRYRRTNVTKWLRRYDRCLAGDLSQLDTLS